MLKEPESFKFNFETRDMHETARQRLEQLKPQLKAESERLRKFGAPVEDDARIDMKAFSQIGRYDPKMIAADLDEIAQKEKLFQSQNQPEELAAKNIGELLEVTKTILFNRYWFKKNFIALRTSKFDDYKSGVDELVFDTYTRKPFAVIDMTTISKDIGVKVRRGGQIKYGLKWEKKNFEPRSLENLPVFVVQIKNEQVLGLAREVLAGELSPESQSMEKSILVELKRQCEDFSATAPNKLSADAYKEAADVFETILKNL